MLGSLFFFITALYIQKDKALVDLVIAGTNTSDSMYICNDEVENEIQDDVHKP